MSVITSCDHEPKGRIGGRELPICDDCRRKNSALYHQGDSETWYGMRRLRPKGTQRRVRSYRYQSLREPTRDDL